MGVPAIGSFLNLTRSIYIIRITTAEEGLEITNAEKMFEVNFFMKAKSLPGLDHGKNARMVAVVKVGAGLSGQKQLKGVAGQQLLFIIKSEARIQAPLTEITDTDISCSDGILLSHQSQGKNQKKYSQNKYFHVQWNNLEL